MHEVNATPVESIVNAEVIFNSNFINLIQINKTRHVQQYFSKNKLFFFVLPNLNKTLYVKCDFAAIRAADMEIIYAIKDDGIIDESQKGSFFPYKYENFNSIYYTSFSKKEECLIYEL